MIQWFLNNVMHLNDTLFTLVKTYGHWVYAIMFLIIFAETGFVVVPFLPGDSLLFAAGAVAAAGSLDYWVIIVALMIAAVLGDAVNYSIGAYIGPKVFRKQ